MSAATAEVHHLVRDEINRGEQQVRAEYPSNANITEFADIAVDLTAGDYVVKGLIHRADVGVIFGESGGGKTFFTLDLALHVASGEAWRGHRMRQAFVLYVASENPRSVSRRVVAWREQHKPAGSVPFALMGNSVDLRDPNSVAQIVAAVKAGMARHGIETCLVVVDTLARAAPGADENASADMSAIIGAADEIRNATGAAVALVHHSGKDRTRGARGHSSLRGAVDFELEVADKVATVTKARDGETGTAYAFRLEMAELGTDDDGDAVTTCIVQTANVEAIRRKPTKVPTNARTAFNCLQGVIQDRGELMPATSAIPPGTKAVTVEVWRDRFREMSRLVTDGEDDPTKAATAFRQRWKRAVDALQNAEIVGVVGTYVWIADKGAGA